MRLMTTAELEKRLEGVYSSFESELSSERFRELVLAACRFYGAARTLETKLNDQGADWRTVARFNRLTTKSYADDYLVRHFGVDLYWAHSATNIITHLNLPAADPGDLAAYAAEEFHQKFIELVAQSA